MACRCANERALRLQLGLCRLLIGVCDTPKTHPRETPIGRTVAERPEAFWHPFYGT